MTTKFISIRISPETEHQLVMLRKDGTKLTAVIARAVDRYFQDQVDAEAGQRLQQVIPLMKMEQGKTYLIKVEEDGSLENIPPEGGEVEDSRSRRVYKNGRFVEKVYRDGKLVETIKGVEGKGKK